MPIAPGPAFCAVEKRSKAVEKVGAFAQGRSYNMTTKFASSVYFRPRGVVLLDAKIQPWLQQLSQFRCRDCASDVGFRSRRRTFSERYILPLFYLQPVRCAECFRRDYRLMSVQVRERLGEVGPKPAISATGRSTTHDRHVA